MSRLSALLLVATHTAVPLVGEWIESFWCPECQESTWYYVRQGSDRTYEIQSAPCELWMQATGVINPTGNPSVGEFTRREARAANSGIL